MNCLHCGKQLALLRKFREDSFCSAEHKELFVESHQTLALDRLKNSLRRIKDRRHLLLNPPAEPEPAFCGFLSQPVTFEVQDFPFGSLTGFDALEFDLLLQPPASSGTNPGTGIILSPAVPLAAPYPNSYAASFVAIDAEPVDWNPSSAFAAPGTSYSSHLLLSQAPIAPAQRGRTSWKPLDTGLAAAQSFRSQIDAPGFSGAEPLTPSFSEAASASTTLVGAGRMLRLRKPSAINHFEKTETLVPTPIHDEEPATPALTASAPADFPAPSAAPQMVDRLFKARPRAAVADTSLPEFVEIQAEPQTALARPAMVPQATASAASTQPQATGRVASPRSERPVDGRTAAMNNRSFDLLESAGSPRIRGSQSAPVREAAPSSMVPPLADRFFKARPRGPVQGLSIPGWDPIDPGQPIIENSGPGFSSLELNASVDAQPVLLDRVYRMRPRGPVPDRTHLANDSQPENALPAFRSTPEPTPFAPSAQLPAASSIQAATAPSFCDKLFRPRPRAGVPDAALPSFTSIEPSPLTVMGDAAVQSLTPSGAASALALGDSTSIAPGPVSGGASAQYSDAVAQLAGRSTHLSPRTGAQNAELAPTFLDRMFRPRPKSGVVDPASPSFHPVTPEPVDLAAKTLAANPSLPVAARADLAPAVLDRLFRPRPRAGVEDRDLPSFQPLAAQPVDLTGEGLTENPSLPVVADADLAPAVLDKLFRPRPKAGVADPSMASFRQLEANAIGLNAQELTASPGLQASAPEGLAPATLDRLLRPRPRTGVPGGAAFASIESSALAGSQDSPLTPTHAAGPDAAVLSASLSLPLVDRLFRPRPRAGVVDPKLASFYSIEPGVPEGANVACCYPEMPAQLMRQARVTRERPIRMRPRVAGSTAGSSEEEEALPEKRSARQVS